jgi:hypothetical protein
VGVVKSMIFRFFWKMKGIVAALCRGGKLQGNLGIVLDIGRITAITIVAVVAFLSSPISHKHHK